MIDGTVQATADGLIILLRERQTVGGYPRIAQIIPSDVDVAAQFRPQDAFRIELIDLATAHDISKQYEQSLKDLAEAVVEYSKTFTMKKVKSVGSIKLIR